jgi:hypothetical protein
MGYVVVNARQGHNLPEGEVLIMFPSEWALTSLLPLTIATTQRPGAR